MREACIYAMLRAIKRLSRLCYRFDINWVHPPPPDPWRRLRLVTFLNHTSLYEPLFVGGFPNEFIKRIAFMGLMPVADKATQRPILGFFFRMVAKNVVAVTRKNDRTWNQVLATMKPDTMVIIMPEGRMMRANCLDKYGRAMTVRGGIADIVQSIPQGRMLLAYSAGLHHVQTPGQRIPRIFKTLRMRLETVDITAYRSRLMDQHGPAGFKKALVRDLEYRRARYCLDLEPAPPPVYAASLG
ncbi:1-acyl-sn-glycerol-3-phosphate acyltransferase [Desulfosarcina sp.]|uniref:1-acyl-sn-glycerol-3-phosphate acyltransferase n=1 Tax=Desulfosarcina sp. TaxID=2027861 RepID=UPI0029B62452|nr:1-acyl-sn-glycerol-3-phosphate acyltransferase [Desulfosarcina sp.]MDX2452296.1 1-acyl-sn-glycerol-3-phosphate acyltransferase [Desulfosarcina sp.]MDX2490076.1 1-acyl-sn-glycerol-3-phosphate acyltransferase [Desulfosarcina sp.]